MRVIGFRSLTRLAIQGLFGRLLLPFLTGLLVYVSALTMLAVIAGRSVGLFSELPVFSACLWFIAALFPLAGRAIRTGSWAGPLREYLMHSLTIPAAATAFLSVAILPFWLEFLLLPILLKIVWTSGFESGPRVSGFDRIFMIAYVLVLVTVAAYALVESPATWRMLVQGLLLPVWLSIACLPFIKLMLLADRERFDSCVISRSVSSTDYGANWPLTIDSVRLCYRHGAVWIEHNRKKYGLNGFAAPLLSRFGHECLDLSDIQRNRKELFSNPSEFELKVPVDRLLQDGLKLGHVESPSD